MNWSLSQLRFEESFMMMTMQLSHYPAAIAQAAQRVNELDSQMMAVQQHINREEGNADRVSAFDPDLKNDTQRKARRFEVLRHESGIPNSAERLAPINC